MDSAQPFTAIVPMAAVVRGDAKPKVDLSLPGIKKAVVKIIRWPAGDEELNDYDAYVAYPQLASILNEAGSRETRAQGMQKVAFRLMVDALIKVNPACKKFYRLWKPGESKVH